LEFIAENQLSAFSVQLSAKTTAAAPLKKLIADR
jgi:hypothetical protein